MLFQYTNTYIQFTYIELRNMREDDKDHNNQSPFTYKTYCTRMCSADYNGRISDIFRVKIN